jgi:hypothetical protein
MYKEPRLHFSLLYCIRKMFHSNSYYPMRGYEDHYSSSYDPEYSSLNHIYPFYSHSHSHNVLTNTDETMYTDTSHALQPYRESKSRYDPLSDTRPGPMVASYIPDKITRNDTVSAAAKFFDVELTKLSGRLHVLFESVRKYGRFDMKNGSIVLDKGEDDKDYLQALGRLWQMGDGYVYVRQELTIQELGERPVVSFHVFHIDHISYIKLPPTKVEDIIRKDPIWKGDVKHYDVNFL